MKCDIATSGILFSHKKEWSINTAVMWMNLEKIQKTTYCITHVCEMCPFAHPWCQHSEEVFRSEGGRTKWGVANGCGVSLGMVIISRIDWCWMCSAVNMLQLLSCRL
jgi:hypothetical protein